MSFRAFGWGCLAFLLSLMTQKLLFLGSAPASMSAPAGVLAVLLVVGPSEEFWKSLMAFAVRPRAGFSTPRQSVMAGVAAAAGYAFFEHLGRFLDPATPVFVLVSKSFLGTSLHALLSIFWSLPAWDLDEPGGRTSWLWGVALAGVIHGLYNCGSFLPAWTGGTLWLATAPQVLIVACLLPCFLNRLPAPSVSEPPESTAPAA